MTNIIVVREMIFIGHAVMTANFAPSKDNVNRNN